MNKNQIFQAAIETGILIQRHIDRPTKADLNKKLSFWNRTKTGLNHVAWMIAQVSKFIKEDKLDKAQRWLGFVQGVIWALGYATIDDLQEINRVTSTIQYMSPEQIRDEMEILSREHLGVSGDEALQMLERGELDGTVMEVELKSYLFLLGER